MECESNTIWRQLFVARFGEDSTIARMWPRLAEALKQKNEDSPTFWLTGFKTALGPYWDPAYIDFAFERGRNGLALIRKGREGFFPSAWCTRKDVRWRTVTLRCQLTAEILLFSCESPQRLWQMQIKAPLRNWVPETDRCGLVVREDGNRMMLSAKHNGNRVLTKVHRDAVEDHYVIVLTLHRAEREASWVMNGQELGRCVLPPSPFYLGYCTVSHSAFVEILP